MCHFLGSDAQKTVSPIRLSKCKLMLGLCVSHDDVATQSDHYELFLVQSQLSSVTMHW